MGELPRNGFLPKPTAERSDKCRRATQWNIAQEVASSSAGPRRAWSADPLGSETRTASGCGETAGLSEKRLDDAAASFGQLLFLCVVVEHQLPVVQPEQVQDRGLVIIGREDVRHRLVSEFIGFAVDGSTPDAAAGQPHAEALAIVIAAAGRRITLRHRQ